MKWIVAALLVAHGGLLAWSACANSATFDEPAHLAAGVAYWKHGDFTVYSLSPPLLRLWEALPAVMAGAVSPDTKTVWGHIVAERHWYYVDRFVYGNFASFAHLLVLARLMMVPLSVLGAWVTYRWAAELYGSLSGVTACVLYCLNPMVLAHGSLATTDIGTATAMLCTTWLWWRFCRQPSWRRWGPVCVAAAAAHLCKFTAVLLWPMLAMMAVPMMVGRDRPTRLKISRGWIGSGLATLVILNAAYGFRGTFAPVSSLTLKSTFMQSMRNSLPGWSPSLLPQTLVEGFDAQKLDTESGYQGFLFGYTYQGSHWWYYPAALAVKMPISLWVLGAIALGSLAVGRGKRRAASTAGEWSLIAAAAVYALGVVVLSDVNIGTRYLLPALAPAMIFISRLWRESQPQKDQESQSPARSVWNWRNGLLAVLAMETLWVCPRFLTFINVAAGGPDSGGRLLSVSDFDWGQGLVDLRRWMGEHQTPSIELAYFGLIDPRIYGVQFSTLEHPGDGRYVAISSYYMNDLRNRMVVGENQREYVQIARGKELWVQPPVAIVGHTIFIFERKDVDGILEIQKK